MEGLKEILYTSDIPNFDGGYIEDLSEFAKTANVSEENRIKFVTSLASISRGKTEASNPESLYKRLLVEAAKGTPSRPLEFLPVELYAGLNKFSVHKNTPFYTIFDMNGKMIKTITDNVFLNSIVKFSHISKLNEPKKIFNSNDITVFNYDIVYKIRTNMRTLLKAGFYYDEVPYSTSECFRAFRLKIPMYVFNHIITHTQLSKEARSDRVTNNTTNGYWLPEDLKERYEKLDKEKLILGANIRKFFETYDIENLLKVSMVDIQNFFQMLKYPREIYQRAMLEFRYKDMIITGWDNNPYTFENFFLERGALPEENKNWVQKETAIVANKLYKMISKHRYE